MPLTSHVDLQVKQKRNNFSDVDGCYKVTESHSYSEAFWECMLPQIQGNKGRKWDGLESQSSLSQGKAQIGKILPVSLLWVWLPVCLLQIWLWSLHSSTVTYDKEISGYQSSAAEHWEYWRTSLSSFFSKLVCKLFIHLPSIYLPRVRSQGNGKYPRQHRAWSRMVPWIGCQATTGHFHTQSHSKGNQEMPAHITACLWTPGKKN